MTSDSSNNAIRRALVGMIVGESTEFACPDGEHPRKFMMRACWLAHSIFGKGRYKSSTKDGTVRITYVPAQAGVAQEAVGPIITPNSPPGAANDAACAPAAAVAPNDDKLLTRKQAVEFLAPWFPQGLTAEQLRAFCNTGRGPDAVRNGRYTLHRVGALRAWIAQRLQPVSGQEAA